MTIPTQTYNAVYEKYSAALQWMGALGVKLGPNRTSHYESVLGHWRTAYKTASADEAKEAFPDFVSSMFEIHDFVDIYEAFNEVPQSKLTTIVKKLQKGVNGPINAVAESPKSTFARNMLFEVLVAAKSHRPQNGVQAIFDAETDTGIKIDERRLWVECKRITTIPKIQDNTRRASQQVGTVLKRKRGARHRGIVAIDVTKLLNPCDKIYVCQDDAHLLTSVDELMNEFIRQRSGIWQRIYERRHRKLIGTIVRFAFMSASESTNLLIHASQWAMNPRLGASEADIKIQRKLVQRLNGFQ